MRDDRDRPRRVTFGQRNDADPSGPDPAEQRRRRRLCPSGRGEDRSRAGGARLGRRRHGRARRRRGGERDRGGHGPPALLCARRDAGRRAGGGVCRGQRSHLPAQQDRSGLRRDGNDLHCAGMARRRRLSRPYRRQPRLSVARGLFAADQRRSFVGRPIGARRRPDQSAGGQEPAAARHPARSRHGADGRAGGVAARIAAASRRCLCAVLGRSDRSGRRRHDRRYRRAAFACRSLCGTDRGGARRRRRRQRLGRGLCDRGGSAASERRRDDAPPTIIPKRAVSLGKAGPFELIELLGEGAVGQVYGARDPLLGRQVAIKMLRRELSGDREFLDRFYGEAQRLGDLNHANITTLYGLYFEGDKPFMVMELVRGRTLKDLLRRTRRLPPRESLAVMAQTLAGLAYAHRAWVIHRDIKPSNLMVTDGGIVKIMDFGIARVHGSLHLTRAGQAFLTPLYASPEQIKGEEVDERSDLYSLGVLFYEMLAGRPPFVAKSEYLLERAHLEDAPPPLAEAVPDLDPRIAAAVMRALAKNPAERFASAEEFGHAVGARAIRGDAPDILQEFIAATFRGAPADETRLNPRANFSRPPPVSEQAGSASSAPAPVTGANFSKPGPIVEPPKRSDGRGRARRRVALIGGIALALAAAAVAILAWLHPPARITAAIPKAPHTTPAPPTPVALLDIRTKPSGATVRIDGAAAGAAPLLHKIPPGKHLVQASLAGYQPKSASIDLQPGQTLPVELGLTPLPAALQIRTIAAA